MMSCLIRIHLIFTLFVNVFMKLPDNLTPIEYKLKIVTNLGDINGKFSFNGSVSIEIKCISSTDSIVLHSKNLKIDQGNAALRHLNQTDVNITISKISEDTDNDLLILTLSENLQADHHYEVELHFEGKLQEEKVGFYKSSYLGKEKQEKWIAVTYFRPDNARRAFPCFDELTFKAKFTISLGRTIKFHSLSNMQLLRTEEMLEVLSDWEWDHFVTSPPMSVHNVGFTITDFTSVELRDHFNIDIKVSRWARENLIQRSRRDIIMIPSATFLYTLALELDVDYPLSKMDIVVMPGYPVPTMECWGLVFWDEDYMVENSKMFQRFNVDILSIVANQMVRQWFGNLVTVKSWTDIWFFDGFNKYLTERLTEHEAPELQEKITQNIISVFNFDAMNISHAVSIPCNHSDSINTFTDDYTNEKTSFLIHMLSHVLGPKKLQKIIRQYLKKYAFSNAGGEELLDLIDSQYIPPNTDVKTIMDTWFSQAGFPLITVTRNYARATVEVKQERFFKNNELLGTDTAKWWIPLTYTTECELEFNKTTPRNWLSPDGESVTVNGPLSSADWILFNTDASGLYLVNYDAKNWDLIIEYLNTPFYQHIPQLDRVILIENAANLAWIGRLDYKSFLSMLMYLALERSWLPQYVAFRRIYDLNALLNRTPVHEKFLNYVRKLFQKHSEGGRSMVNNNSRERDPQLTRFHQRSGFLLYVPLVEMKIVILCTDDAIYQYSWSDYMEYNRNVRFRSKMLLSLSCSQDKILLTDYLNKSLIEEALRNDEITPIFAAIARNPIAFDLITNFLNDNIKTIYNRISPNVLELSPVMIEIARQIVKDRELSWLKTFIKNNQEYLVEIQSRVDEALELARLNVQWYGKHYETIEAYLNENFDE